MKKSTNKIKKAAVKDSDKSQTIKRVALLFLGGGWTAITCSTDIADKLWKDFENSWKSVRGDKITHIHGNFINEQGVVTQKLIQTDIVVGIEISNVETVKI